MESGPSAPPNTMYAETSLDYIRSREDEALHKVISQLKSNSNLIEEVNKT